MKIQELEISNFRNYEYGDFEFSDETNVLYGDNAQGKTNALEAIFVAATSKSHKGSKDREMVRMNMEEGHIRVYIEKNKINHKIDVHLKRNGKKGIAIDGVPAKKSSDLFGFMNVIFFSPEDLSIIKYGPDIRRKFINMELCQIDKTYLYHLTQYNKIIKQRNNLLKQISLDKNLLDTLEVWDIQLIKEGTQIIKAREEFVQLLNSIIKDIHSRLSNQKEILRVEYEPNVTANMMEEKVFFSRDRDIFQTTTNIGPHRDDLCFYINDVDIRKYGSQGQQRTAALSLKLAEIEIVKKVIKEEPILLLDDVLSELDRTRQNCLLENIKGIQTIITCTGLEEFVQSGININKTFEIKNGTID